MLILVACTNFLGYLIGWTIEFLCCLSIIRKLNYQTQPDLIIILSLALADTLACWSSLPGCLESVLGRPLTPWSDWTIGFVNSIAWLSASLHMNALALNRFVAVVLPLRYDLICSARNSFRFVFALWLVALSLAVAVANLGYPVIWEPMVVNTVFDFSHNTTAPDFVAGMLAALNYGMYTVTALSYGAVLVKLVHLRFWPKPNQTQPNLALCTQCILIYFVFILQARSWNLLALLGSDYWFLISYTSMINFTVNGYIYLIFNQNIRTAVHGVLHQQHHSNVVDVMPLRQI